jgi:tripartite ATP-independent transporter DctM subunit
MVAVSSSAKEMAKQDGYSVAEAMGVLCAGAAMGDTIPPSIGLIVLSSVSYLSVGALFAAGLLPACIMALALLCLIRFKYRARARGGNKASLRVLLLTSWRALPVLTVPIFLILSIGLGITTPSNSSAIAVALALIVVLSVERSMSARSLYRTIVECGTLAGSVLFMLASATLFARALTIASIPQRLASLVASGDIGGRWGFLFVSSLVLIVMGMIMEGLPAILIFAPLLIPVAVHLGINSLQYGIITVVCIGLGANSPPMGVGLFVGAQIGAIQVREIAKTIRPYLVALYLGLWVIVIIPQISLWIPRALHLTS